MGKNKLRQVKAKELPDLRRQLLKEQNGCCAVLKREISFEESVVDHQHMTSYETIGENGAGLVRGVLHRQVNSVEGKYFNTFIRYGIDKLGISFTDFLRNLADYIDQDNLRLIHPNEEPQKPILKKSSYNKLKKAINGKQKMPPYRMSKGRNKKPIQKLTKALEELFIKYNIEPEFYA